MAAEAADEETNAIGQALFTDLYAGQDRSIIAREWALGIAELQSLVIRARKAKAELLQDALDEPDLADLLDQYRRIDRYEHRALSRRKTLLRDMY